ncbi:hypothetical protein KM176_18505 [Pseudooceanicola sp. CBS1P-1]|uniref:Chemotaxis protein n=1 Tax=Pseudooceanicola albus TaxID=2692189 RepID=A0A6L7G9V9_9RHOB|nr:MULTISPECIES: hypothetical protein [Pseudooceanicola]MBT9385869.1 hypothetical protein [Pseudooceanicola endophyticus]MXN20100.1 hypothetical protein [Pseudooceanicola albus]
MEMISDILLVAGALGAVFYCFILARRLARFNDLESGVGGAVAVLSAQVDDLTRTLKAAQGAASDSSASLEQLTDRAEGVAKRLELLVASMHDLPEPGRRPPPTAAEPPEEMARIQPVFARRTGGQ